jgi:hypothetical protein
MGAKRQPNWFERCGGRPYGGWLLALLALATLWPQAGWAFTLFGSNFISPGKIWDPGFSIFGEEASPRLDLDGLLRFQVIDAQLQNQGQNLLVPEVDLQANLQLTATQRVYALVRPLEYGDREPTFFQFGANHGWTGRFDATPQALFYEGEPFNWLSPSDRLPLDFNLTVGRVPLFLHNGLWFNNFYDGFALSKNNIQLGNLSNLNIMYFLTLGETMPGITLDLESRRQAEKKVMGVDTNLDWSNYFVEASWALSYANSTLSGGRQDLDRNFWAISVTRSFSYNAAVSLRAMGSTPNSSAGAGELFALEAQRSLFGTQIYSNIFGATSNWFAPSVQGSALNREGILFTFDRLVATPQLNPRASGTVGGVVGDIINPLGHVTYTPEFGWLFDNESTENDQLGVALLIQIDMASLLMPGDTLKILKSRGLLYGALIRWTLNAVRNENTHLAGERFDFGSNLEFIYQF